MTFGTRQRRCLPGSPSPSRSGLALFVMILLTFLYLPVSPGPDPTAGSSHDPDRRKQMNDEIAGLADRLRAKRRGARSQVLSSRSSLHRSPTTSGTSSWRCSTSGPHTARKSSRRTRRERQDPARASRPTGVQLHAARHVAGAGSPGRLHQRAGGRRGDPRGARPAGGVEPGLMDGFRRDLEVDHERIQ